MPSSVLDVVVEEAAHPKHIDTMPFLALQSVVWEHHHKRVFKEYILSPEVYPLQVREN